MLSTKKYHIEYSVKQNNLEQKFLDLGYDIKIAQVVAFKEFSS